MSSHSHLHVFWMRSRRLEGVLFQRVGVLDGQHAGHAGDVAQKRCVQVMADGTKEILFFRNLRGAAAY